MKLTTKYGTIGLICLGLLACNDNPKPDTPKISSQSTTSDFVGCYTISHDEPAVIKISQDEHGFSMQMKEPANKADVWDRSEKLQLLSIDEGWHYFEVNALGLQKSDVDQIIARPDGMFVLAQVKDTAKQLNASLDSNYVSYVFKGSNTIYHVACDDKPVDILHADSSDSTK
ncbi:hypothetical protein LU293_00480 [Moraxella nasovis]|uniref:hypothetical protein n=1 Tax=Moraxella nasovis TaxID=2904121 RepID=UPI001F614731|nr:hypothetical protein [Moraxella nasovis]UNU73427.1 hypothetical protein LU293_00480 [Moraxella nasovis]